MHARQFAQALQLQESNGWARFVTMQDHYNLIYREEENEMLPLCPTCWRIGHLLEPAGAVASPVRGAKPRPGWSLMSLVNRSTAPAMKRCADCTESC